MSDDVTKTTLDLHLYGYRYVNSVMYNCSAAIELVFLTCNYAYTDYNIVSNDQSLGLNRNQILLYQVNI